VTSIILNFFSFYSYQIYFIHYLILTVLANFITQWSLNWISLTVAVMGLTVIVQIVYNLLNPFRRGD
jgi:peptidoglycan/LPS O-acetylase OafA/YrhL